MERIAASQDAQGNEAKAAEEKKHAADDLSAQQEMARWSNPIFIATAASAVFTLGSVIALVLIFRAQQKLSKDQTRAYLEVLRGQFTVREGGHFSITLFVFNSGQTPALNAKLDAEFVYTPQTDDMGRPTGEPTAHRIETLPTDIPAKAEQAFSTLGATKFSLEFLASHKGSSGGMAGTAEYEAPFVSVSGLIRYEDALGQPRELQ